MRNIYTDLVRGSKQKKLLGRRKDNIEMELKGIWYKNVGWIKLVQDGLQWRALVDWIMNL